ncbi:MAG: NACHT domain-containing protein [Acidobacteria bacterium]|nr:NACHT domain-containing protein [Acidobacteriota bacterium]
MDPGITLLTALGYSAVKMFAPHGSKFDEIGGGLLGEVAGTFLSDTTRSVYERMRPGIGRLDPQMNHDLKRAVSRGFLLGLLRTIHAYAEQRGLKITGFYDRYPMPATLREYFRLGQIKLTAPREEIQAQRWAQTTAVELIKLIGVVDRDPDGRLPESADLALPGPEKLFRDGRVTVELTDRVWEWLLHRAPDPPDGFKPLFAEHWFAAFHHSFAGELKAPDSKAGAAFTFTLLTDLNAKADLQTKLLWFMIGAAYRKQDDSIYLDWLRGQVKWIELRGIKLATQERPRFEIDRIYIRLRSKGGEPIEEALRPRTVVIQGGAGSGKTTLLRNIAWQLCRDEGEPKLALPFQGAYPLWVRVSELDQHITESRKQSQPGTPRVDSDHQWISHYFGSRGWGLDAAFFVEKLKSGSTVLLIDGLDEAGDDKRRIALVEMIEQVRSCYPCRILVSTRPHTHQERAALSPDFERVWIEDLDDATVNEFLAQWSECLQPGNEVAAAGLKGALRAALDGNAVIREMARNPLMLTCVALVYDHQMRLPDNRSELYEAVVEWLAKAREKREGRPDWNRCLKLLGSLALKMQADGQSGQVMELTRDAAAKVIRDDRFFQQPEKNPLDVAREFLHAEEGDSGIIVSRNAPNLTFWHRSFQEYLAARAIAALPEEQVVERAKAYLYTGHWREVLILLTGCLSRREEFLDQIFLELADDACHSRPLAQQAHAYGVMGAMLADLPKGRYLMGKDAKARYGALGQSVMAIFTVEGARAIGIQDRIAAADALALAGDPRLKRPSDPEYWVKVEKRGISLGKYPVTVWEYQEYLNENRITETPRHWAEQTRHPSRPVVGISRQECEAYCKHFGCRLPSPVEWELATDGEYPWGKERPDLTKANFDNEVGHATPVGLYPAGSTKAGLSDMAGNVWERTSASGVWKGGGYASTAARVRAAFRNVDHVGGDSNDGFRCFRE